MLVPSLLQKLANLPIKGNLFSINPPPPSLGGYKPDPRMEELIRQLLKDPIPEPTPPLPGYKPDPLMEELSKRPESFPKSPPSLPLPGYKPDPLMEELVRQPYKSTPTAKGGEIKAYHGSPREIEDIGFGEGVRSNSFLGNYKKVKSGAIFFTPDKDMAKFFAQNRADYLKDMGEKNIKPTVYERMLNLKNPIDLTDFKEADFALMEADIDVGKYLGSTTEAANDLETFAKQEFDTDKEALEYLWKLFDNKEVVDKLKAAGFDGAIIQETGGKGISYAIFDPKQASKLSLKDVAKGGEIAPKKGVPKYQRLVELQRKAEGWIAAVKDPQTGKVYSGYSHKSAINSVPKGDDAWGRLESEWDRATNNVGFLDKNGNFISRDEADKMLSIKTMEDRKDLLAGKNLVRLFHNWEDSELISPDQISKLSPKEGGIEDKISKLKTRKEGK